MEGKKVKIIVDAMGGDHAPEEIVRGAFEAADEYGCELVLCGDEGRIRDLATRNGWPLDKHRIVHSDIAVSMEDDPMVVLHSKKKSSMCVGLRLLAAGEGDAFVSAGNTGALFTAASLIVRKVPGLQRAAIASIIPMKPPVLLLDSGANVTVNDEYLEQFAVMGSVYMKSIYGIPCPRVGLLNNGTEECKGTQLQMDTYKRLSVNPDINFIGNVEANHIPLDACDVLVTDGFTGNILLKSIEGMGRLMLTTLRDCFTANLRTKIAAGLVKDKIKGVKKDFDSSEYGGAPLLGLRRPVIKAHGSSKAKALKNAVRQAIGYSGNGIIDEITDEIKRISAQPRPTGTAPEEDK